MTTEIQQSVTARSALTFWPAMVILAIFVFGQIFIGGIAGVAAAISVVVNGNSLQDADAIIDSIGRMMPAAIFIGMVFAGGLALFVSYCWFKNDIRRRELTGAAWVTGTARSLPVGLIIGFTMGIIYLAVSPLMCESPDVESLGPLAKMAYSPGFGQILWVILAVILAPLIEEMLFRGVIFAGISRSLGPVTAGLISTILFVMLHVTEAILFWPAFVFIGAMAGAALWMRIRHCAIGPAVAVHFGYNLVLVTSVLIWG